MAFSEALADRVRDALSGREGVSERKMFGGIAFMLKGNMAVGVAGEEAIADDRDLAAWVDAGADHAASLPPKPKK
jgi:TfoX/Sxy family transcriptional regulator of competence genes